MTRVGLGGLQNFEAAPTTPPIGAQRLAFMTPAGKSGVAREGFEW